MPKNPILVDIPEEIETSRLCLKMPKAGLGPQLHEAIMDGYDDSIKWLGWPQAKPSTEDVEIDCRKHNAEFILRDFIRFIIVEKSTDRTIGRCAFPSFQSNWLIPQFGISYFIRRSDRAQGYATEAAHALAYLAFKLLHAQKIEIFCDADNRASCRIPEKLGFIHEYTQRGGWLRADSSLAQLRTYALFDIVDLPTREVRW
jgi:RimJ/RimL family protein N-acetyltransferase